MVVGCIIMTSVSVRFQCWTAAFLVEAVLDRVLAIGLLLNFVELVAEGVSRVRLRNSEAENAGACAKADSTEARSSIVAIS